MHNQTNQNDLADLKPVPRYPAVIRLLWHLGLRLRFHLFQRHRYNRLVNETVAGHPIVVLPQVFNPKLLRTGEFLAKSLSSELIPEGAAVLDLGCGTGIGAVAAAQWTDQVTAVDINAEAVRCAVMNAELNHVVDRVQVLESDLFSALQDRKFDVVIFNPPFFRGEPKDPLDQAWRARDTLERFAEQLPRHLTVGGCGLIVFSSHGDVDGLLNALIAQKFRIELLKSLDLVNEVLMLYRAVPGIEEAS